MRAILYVALSIHFGFSVASAREKGHPLQSLKFASKGFSGGYGNGPSSHPSVSYSGRYIAFESAASNLVATDSNSVTDIFVRDTATSTTSLASVSTAGDQGNARSFSPSISGNGRYVVFASLASNLVAGVTNGKANIFVRDLVAGTTAIVSATPAIVSTLPFGELSNGGSDSPSISDDGRFIGYITAATNMGDAPDANGKADFIVKDTLTGASTRISLSSSGAEGDDDVIDGQISGDGQSVVFTSKATNMVVGDTNQCADVFLRSLLFGTTELMSMDSAGVIGNRSSGSAAVSQSGRFVVFESRAGNLVPDDTNGHYDIFLRDRHVGSIERVSVNGLSGAQISYDSRDPKLSASGRFVLFKSLSPDFDPVDENKLDDVFMRDRLVGETKAVSIDDLIGDGHDWSREPAISGDGHIAVFVSRANNFRYPTKSGHADVIYRINIFSQSIVQVAIENVLGDVAGMQNGFRFTRAGNISYEAVVNYSVAGTAVSGTDFAPLSGTITIPSGYESVVLPVTILSGSSSVGKTIEITVIASESVQPGTVSFVENTIAHIDQDVVGVTTVDPISSESETAQRGIFRIYRDGARASSLTVHYSVSGTAVNGVDYSSISGAAIIPSSQLFVDVEIAAIADASDEGAESVRIDIDSDSAYSLGAETYAYVFIEDSPCSLLLGNKCIRRMSP